MEQLPWEGKLPPCLPELALPRSIHQKLLFWSGKIDPRSSSWEGPNSNSGKERPLRALPLRTKSS